MDTSPLLLLALRTGHHNRHNHRPMNTAQSMRRDHRRRTRRHCSTDSYHRGNGIQHQPVRSRRSRCPIRNCRTRFALVDVFPAVDLQGWAGGGARRPPLLLQAPLLRSRQLSALTQGCHLYTGHHAPKGKCWCTGIVCCRRTGAVLASRVQHACRMQRNRARICTTASKRTGCCCDPRPRTPPLLVQVLSIDHQHSAYQRC